MTIHSHPPIGRAWLQLQKRYLPIILGIGGLAVIIDGAAHFAFGNGSQWVLGLNELAVFCDLTVLPFAIVNGIFLAQRMLQNAVHGGWKMLTLKIVSTLVTVALTSWALESWYTYLGYVDDDFIALGMHEFSPSTTNTIEKTFIAFVFSIPIFLWQLRVEELQLQLIEKDHEQERLTQLKTQAELHALQSRINPHFLFNSFNSIASLISVDSVRAEKMVVQLSELFRYSLNSQESNFVTIAEELRIVRTYLEIEKVRFGENIDYQIDVSNQLNERLIPRFLLQPLVENAVKHAISKVKQGEILLKITAQDDVLTILIHDNGPPFPEPIEPGYGLQSTYDKLNLLYPGKHSITFLNSPEKQLCITLTNPASHE